MIRIKMAFATVVLLMLLPLTAAAHHGGYYPCDCRIAALHQSGDDVEIIIEAWGGRYGYDSWVEVTRIEEDCDDCREKLVYDKRIYHNYYRSDYHSYYYRGYDRNAPIGDLEYNLYSDGKWCDVAYIDVGFDLIGPCGVDSTGSVDFITPVLLMMSIVILWILRRKPTVCFVRNNKSGS